MSMNAINNKIVLGDFTLDNGSLNLTSGNVVLTSGDVSLTSGDVELTVGDVNLTNGDVNLTLGNITLPNTAATPTGMIMFGGTAVANRFIHNFGTDNTFLGAGAGNVTLTTALNNTGVGPGVLDALTDGDNNTAMGKNALTGVSSGACNSAFGMDALTGITTGDQNTGHGFNSLASLTTGSNNQALGYQSLSVLATGGYNLAAGDGSGVNYSGAESSNLLLLNDGVNGESNKIRIGTAGTGSGQQDRCYIAGIYGVTVGGTNSAVLIDNGHMLGTVSSSLRYKDNVQDMSEQSSGLMDLRPVIFNWKKDKNKTIQYGLIAEEVHEVLPGLVNYNDEGKPDGVRYHDMPAMLLNELKKQNKIIISLMHKIEKLEKKIN